MTDRYSEWRDFYAEKVRSWMSLEELRAECGMLQTTDATSTEVLLIHAMHALEECVQRDEAMRAEVGALREALAALITWIPSAYTYRRLGFDPKTPMQALKEAEAVLFNENKQ